MLHLREVSESRMGVDTRAVCVLDFHSMDLFRCSYHTHVILLSNKCLIFRSLVNLLLQERERVLPAQAGHAARLGKLK